MGLLSGKAILLAGTILVGSSVGVVAYDGSETLNNVKSKIAEQSANILQFKQNEDALKGKVKELVADANSKIGQANAFIQEQKAKISGLETKVSDLEGTVSTLNDEIAI